MMTEIIKAAAALGDMLKNDTAGKRLLAAKDMYEHDEAFNRLLTEYTVQQKAMTMEYSKDEPDADFVAVLEKRISELTALITEHPVYIEYQQAEQEYSDIISLINDEISFRVTGKRSCTGDCSSCGGCKSRGQ